MQRRENRLFIFRRNRPGPRSIWAIFCLSVPIGNPIRHRPQLGSASLEAKDCRKPSGVKGTGGFRGDPGRLWPHGRTAPPVRLARNSARSTPVPQEDSGAADLRPPGVRSQGGGCRPAELPRLAASPAVAPVAVPAHPGPGTSEFCVSNREERAPTSTGGIPNVDRRRLWKMRKPHVLRLFGICERHSAGESAKGSQRPAPTKAAVSAPRRCIHIVLAG